MGEGPSAREEGLRRLAFTRSTAKAAVNVAVPGLHRRGRPCQGRCRFTSCLHSSCHLITVVHVTHSISAPRDSIAPRGSCAELGAVSGTASCRPDDDCSRRGATSAADRGRTAILCSPPTPPPVRCPSCPACVPVPQPSPPPCPTGLSAPLPILSDLCDSGDSL